MKRSGPPWGEPLRRAFGAVGGARRLHSSPRSRVWRVRLASGPAVVKQVVGDGAAERFARELTALSVLALHAAVTGEVPVVPEVLGSDDADLVLVLRDVGSRSAASAGSAGSAVSAGSAGSVGSDRASAWPLQWAASLARLHLAGTVVAPGSGLPTASVVGSEDVERFLRFARTVLGAGAVDGPVADVVRAELDGVVGRLAAASSTARALLHGDPCPDNALTTPAGIVFVDLEAACLGDPLTELAYLRVGFPTCWCFQTLPAEVVTDAEAQYRGVWAAGGGAPLDGDLADACVGWALRGDALVERARRDGTDHLARVARKDWRWGTATARQRLAHRFAVTAALAAPRPDLSATAALATSLGLGLGSGAFRAL